MTDSRLGAMCRLCQGPTESIFSTRDYRRPQDSTEYEVVWCNVCAYGGVSAKLSPDQVASFYEVDYYTHRPRSAASSTSVFGRIRRRIAAQFDRGFEITPQEVGTPGRLLDLGCGDGSNLAMMKNGGFNVTGVEPDPHAREVASGFGPVFAGTAEHPPAEVGGNFDYVIMIHVLEHTISPLDALANARLLLRDGGKLIVEVPNCEALGFREFGPSWPWTDAPRHLHFFTERSLDAAMRRSGFKVTAMHLNGFARQFDAEWISQLNEIHDCLQPPKHMKSWFARQSWWLLFKTLLAPDRRRYDTIRVHAEKA